MSDQIFNPAYVLARCGQKYFHSPHVVDSGPDQPRNCPGVGSVTSEIRTDGGFDPCIGGGSSRDCERGECNARAMCAAALMRGESA